MNWLCKPANTLKLCLASITKFQKQTKKKKTRIRSAVSEEPQNRLCLQRNGGCLHLRYEQSCLNLISAAQTGQGCVLYTAEADRWKRLRILSLNLSLSVQSLNPSRVWNGLQMQRCLGRCEFFASSGFHAPTWHLLGRSVFTKIQKRVVYVFCILRFFLKKWRRIRTKKPIQTMNPKQAWYKYMREGYFFLSFSPSLCLSGTEY